LLHSAVGRTSVACDGVSVVALETAQVDSHSAGLIALGVVEGRVDEAGPAPLDLAVGVASVARNVVAVVALFSFFDDLVATGGSAV